MQDRLKEGEGASEIVGFKPLPTTLHLFRIKEADIGSTAERLNFSVRLDRQNTRAINAQSRLSETSRAKMEKLWEVKESIPEEVYLARSSQVAGVMYLRLYEELYESRGLSEQEFMEFYNLALHVSTSFWDPYFKTVMSKGVQTARLIDNIKGSKLTAELIVTEAKKTYGGTIPGWFSGSMDEWKTFLVYHTSSQYYLDPASEGDSSPPHLKPPTTPMPEWFDPVNNRFIRSGGIPDWAIPGGTILVPPNIVTAELAQDTADLNELGEKGAKLDSQISYLKNLINQNAVKLISRFNKALRREFPETPSSPPETFVDLVTYLAAINGNQIVLVDPDTLTPEDSLLLRRSIVNFNEHLDSITREFTYKNVAPEMIALFLEKKLIEAGIISAATDKTDAKLGLLFDLVNSQIPEEETYKLRSENKKKFNVLYYELKPLLSALPDNAKQYLSELNILSSDQSIETMIWEIAEALYSQIKNTRVENSKQVTQLEKSLLEMARFSHRWLKENWFRAATSLYNYLHPAVEAEKQEKHINGSDGQTNYNQEEYSGEEETERVSKQIEAGNLNGWRIYYTDNKSLDPIHLTEIEGGSLQERADSLKEYMRTMGFTCPIKPENVIGTFEQIVGNPDSYQEWVRIRKSVNGLEFKKIKKARSGRIFYRMDEDQKNIVFFIYKKEDWSYRF